MMAEDNTELATTREDFYQPMSPSILTDFAKEEKRVKMF